MNNPKLKSSISIAALVFVFFSLSARAEGDSGEIRNAVREYQSHGDWKAIAKVLSAEVQLYKTSPTFANYSDLCGIADELSSGISNEPAEPYWLFRKATWQVLILPLPIIEEPDQVRTIFDNHRYLLHDVMYTTEGSPYDKVYDVDRRHDTAMLLLAYAASLKRQIIPNYQLKPVAPFNAGLADQIATKQNFIDNNLQQELQSAFGYISGAFVNELARSYARKPKNYDEAKALVDTLGMPDNEKKIVLGAAK